MMLIRIPNLPLSGPRTPPIGLSLGEHIPPGPALSTVRGLGSDVCRRARPPRIRPAATASREGGPPRPSRDCPSRSSDGTPDSDHSRALHPHLAPSSPAQSLLPFGRLSSRYGGGDIPRPGQARPRRPRGGRFRCGLVPQPRSLTPPRRPLSDPRRSRTSCAPGFFPEAYTAPRELCDLRELLRDRATLTRMGSTVKNRAHAILAKHGIANEHTPTCLAKAAASSSRPSSCATRPVGAWTACSR